MGAREYAKWGELERSEAVRMMRDSENRGGY